MSSIQGKPHKGAGGLKNGDSSNDLDFATVQPLGPNKSALDVIPNAAFYVGANNRVAEAGSTSSTIVLTGHDIFPGDIIRMTSVASNPIQIDMGVHSVIDANTIQLVGSLTDINGADAPIAAADTFDILRPISIRVTASGAMAQGPITFELDGVDQVVLEDTVTPANNHPLPVKITGASGDINITAQDLHMQLESTGLNPDSVQIGDLNNAATIKVGAVGPTNLAAENSLRTSDFYVYDTLITIDGVLDAIKTDTGLSSTEAKQDTIITALGLQSTAAHQVTAQTSLTAIAASLDTLDNTVAGNELQVDIVSSTLPSGASTEAKQDTIITALGLQSTAAHQVTAQTSLTAIAASLDTLDNTVAGNELQVDIITSALPTGAATAAKQDTIIANTADLDVQKTLAIDFSSTNVAGGGAYTEILAAVSNLSATREITIFMSTGDPMYLAVGAVASEADKILIPPGGFATPIKVTIAATTRLSLTRLNAGTTSVGNMYVNLLG